MAEITHNPQRVGYDACNEMDETLVTISEFVEISLKLRESDSAAFYAHCAAVCKSIHYILNEEEYLDPHPSPTCRTVGRLARDDIDARRGKLKDGSAVFNIYKYTRVDHAKSKVLCADMMLALLGADGELYKTNVYVSPVPLRTNTRYPNGKRVEVLNIDRFLKRLFEQAGTKTYVPLQLLGYVLTDPATWAMLDAGLSKNEPSLLPEL